MNFSITYQAQSIEEFDALLAKYSTQATAKIAPPQDNEKEEGNEYEQAFISAYGPTRLKQTLLDKFNLVNMTREQCFKWLYESMQSGLIQRGYNGAGIEYTGKGERGESQKETGEEGQEIDFDQEMI
jgi:hypothetical protein